MKKNKSGLSKKIICIVDDEPFILEMYSKKLINEGFEVIGACDGEDGLVKIKKCKPDIILTDLIMPKKDGFSLIRDLNDNPDLSKIPKVVLTNIDDTEKRMLACQLGVLFFVIKSQCLSAELTKIVKEILSVTLRNPMKNVICSQ